MTDPLLMFVDGKNHLPTSGEFFDTHDPSNGAVLASVAKGNEEDVAIAVTAAEQTSEAAGTAHILQATD